jgi:hypothetical protein
MQPKSFAALFRQKGSCLNRYTNASLAGVYALALLTVFGCGGSSTQNNDPPVSPATATIVAPTNGATLSSLPVAVSINLSENANPANVKVTLDGNDISSLFTVSGSSTLQGILSSTNVYVGANRLKASVGSQVSSTQFTYDPSQSPPVSTPQPTSFASSLPDVIPIETRVMMTNSNGQKVWGIQVGNTAYPDPNAYTDGFQVLLPNRQTLAEVSNQRFDIQANQNVSDFVTAISPSSNNVQQCGIGGCLEVIQSLNSIGYNPCQSSSLTACFTYDNAFASIGATETIYFANSFDDDLGYSFVGNVGSEALHAGSQFERITCQASNCANFPAPDSQTVLAGIAPNGTDVMPTINNTGSTGTTKYPAGAYSPALTISNNGEIIGSLILDSTQSYTFAYSDPPAKFSMTVAPDSPTRIFSLSTSVANNLS